MKALFDYLLELLRRLVRPLATGYLLYLLGFGVSHPEVSEERVWMVFWLTVVAMGFWFGERAFKAVGFNFAELMKQRVGGGSNG